MKCSTMDLECAWFENKLNDIDFIELVKKYDILLFSETWLSSADNSDFDIQGYTCDYIFGNKSVESFDTNTTFTTRVNKDDVVDSLWAETIIVLSDD